MLHVAVLLGRRLPEATLPGMKNIVLFDYQNSRARACSVGFLGTTLAICKVMATVFMTD